MPSRLRRACGPLLALALATGPGPAVPQTAPAPSRIQLLALNQPPCTVPSAQAVLTAKIAYRVAAQEPAAAGFDVAILFQSTAPGTTFSIGQWGSVDLANRNDTLTLKYPLAALLTPRHPLPFQLQRPLTCYFYLRRKTGPGRSTVIAQTPPVVFAECQ